MFYILNFVVVLPLANNQNQNNKCEQLNKKNRNLYMFAGDIFILPRSLQRTVRNIAFPKTKGSEYVATQNWLSVLKLS